MILYTCICYNRSNVCGMFEILTLTFTFTTIATVVQLVVTVSRKSAVAAVRRVSGQQFSAVPVTSNSSVRVSRGVSVTRLISRWVRVTWG